MPGQWVSLKAISELIWEENIQNNFKKLSENISIFDNIQLKESVSDA